MYETHKREHVTSLETMYEGLDVFRVNSYSVT